MRLGDRRIVAPFELKDFSLGHAANRVREDQEYVRVAVFDDHRTCARVEEVSRENRATVTPQRIRRRLAAPQFRNIDHVVVQQCRGMEQFDRGPDLNAAGTRVAAKLRGQHHQGGAHSLATGFEQVLAEQADECGVRAELFAHRALDEFEADGVALEGLGKDPRIRSQRGGGLRHRGAG
jgi:hypothetical protein